MAANDFFWPSLVLVLLMAANDFLSCCQGLLACCWLYRILECFCDKFCFLPPSLFHRPIMSHSHDRVAWSRSLGFFDICEHPAGALGMVHSGVRAGDLHCYFKSIVPYVQHTLLPKRTTSRRVFCKFEAECRTRYLRKLFAQGWRKYVRNAKKDHSANSDSTRTPNNRCERHP